jgi:hypothetical protein
MLKFNSSIVGILSCIVCLLETCAPKIATLILAANCGNLVAMGRNMIQNSPRGAISITIFDAFFMARFRINNFFASHLNGFLHEPNKLAL